MTVFILFCWLPLPCLCLLKDTLKSLPLHLQQYLQKQEIACWIYHVSLLGRNCTVKLHLQYSLLNKHHINALGPMIKPVKQQPSSINLVLMDMFIGKLAIAHQRNQFIILGYNSVYKTTHISPLLILEENDI